MPSFDGLFSEEPETEYIPDSLGRLGQGGYVVKTDPEPFGAPSPRFNDFIAAEQSGMGLRDLFGPKPLAIKGPVGPTAPNRRADVGKVETFLSRTDNHDLTPTDGPTGYYGLRLEDSINAFQTANGLKSDGLLNPHGKTLRTLTGKLKDQLKAPTAKLAGPLPLMRQSLGMGGRARATPVKFHPSGGLPRTITPEIPGLAGGPVPKAALPQPISPEIQKRIGKIKKKTQEFLRLAKLGHRLSPFIESSPIGSFVPSVRITESIKAMERFLKGDGGVKIYDPKWMLENPRLRAAAKRNEDNFVKWMTGENVNEKERERIDRVLLGLKDGQTIRDGTPFQGRYNFDKTKDKFADQRLLLINGHVFSNGNFSFSRKGNIITVTGMVEQKISDPFDWKKGSVRSFGLGLEIRHDDMLWLEKYAKAKPFLVRSVWWRKLTWKLQIVRDSNTGAKRFVGVGRPNWSDAK